MKKSNSKILLPPFQILSNFENPSSKVTRFKDPKAAILTLKMHTGSRLCFCKIIPEAACDKIIFVHFLQPMTDLEKHHHTQKVLIKMFRPLKKEQSRDTVP
jgi:hypothetical protein